MESLPILSSFAAGELSPKLYGRVDIEGYEQGVQEMLNVIADPRGPAYRRGGGVHNQRYQNLDRMRLLPYQLSQTQPFIIAVYDSNVDVIQPPVRQNSVNILTNGDFSGGLAGWQVTTVGSAQADDDIARATVTLTPGNAAGEVTSLYQPFSVTNPTTQHQLVVMGSLKGTDANNSSVQFNIGTTAGGSEVSSTTVGDYTTYQQITFTPGAGNTALHLTVTCRDFSSSPEEDEFQRQSWFTLLLVSEAVTVPAKLNRTAPWTRAHLSTLQGRLTPNAASLFILHPAIAPQAVSYASGTWTLQEINLTGKPTEWVAGNFPNTVAFHQGRSWWGGCPNNPETFWVSKSGDFLDLTPGGQASDGFTRTIERDGLIRWIESAKNLLMGTDSGEYLIESEGPVISNADIEIIEQSAYGSGQVQSFRLGPEVLYLSPDRRKLRGMWYQWTESGWLSQDITFTSDHILSDLGATDFAFARNPNEIIWLSLGNGLMVGCSYHRSGNKQPIMGWHKHQTQGAFLDVATVELEGNSELWYAALRYVGGQPEVHVEQYVPDVYLDNHVLSLNNSKVTTVSGLEHLEGYAVQVVADGAVYPYPLTVSGGSITLQDFYAANTIYVGLGFVSRIRTLPLATYIAPGNNTAAMLKKWDDIYLRLTESVPPMLNGYRPPYREPATPMNFASPAQSGSFLYEGLDWSIDGELVVEEDQPTPFAVNSIFGGLRQETV